MLSVTVDRASPNSVRLGGGNRGGGVDGREGAGDEALEGGLMTVDDAERGSSVVEGRVSRRPGWINEEKNPDRRFDARV